MIVKVAYTIEANPETKTVILADEVGVLLTAEYTVWGGVQRSTIRETDELKLVRSREYANAMRGVLIKWGRELAEERADYEREKVELDGTEKEEKC